MSKKKSRRGKISLGYIAKGEYTVIPAEQVAESNRRIKKFMIPVVREHKRKMAESIRWARTKIINT